jgi:hypothetical protein
MEISSDSIARRSFSTIEERKMLRADDRFYLDAALEQGANKKDSLMLRPGDRVSIRGTFEQGVVTEVHTHDVVALVQLSDGHAERKYSHESLRFAPLIRDGSRVSAR